MRVEVGEVKSGEMMEVNVGKKRKLTLKTFTALLASKMVLKRMLAGKVNLLRERDSSLEG